MPTVGFSVPSFRPLQERKSTSIFGCRQSTSSRLTQSAVESVRQIWAIGVKPPQSERILNLLL